MLKDLKDKTGDFHEGGIGYRVITKHQLLSGRACKILVSLYAKAQNAKTETVTLGYSYRQ